MASKIGIPISIDGEKEFRDALKRCKQETQNLKNEIIVLNAGYRENRNSMEALTAKQEALTQKQEAYKTQLKTAIDALNNAKNNYNACADELDRLVRELDEAKEKQEEMKKAGDTTSDAYQEQTKKIESLEKEIDDCSQKQEAARNSVNKWHKEVNTASNELNKCDKELQKNEKYLDEAKKSSDGCATSIDKYGNEVEEAATQTGKLSVSLGDMVKNKIIDLAGDALRDLGQKAIDAAKYVVEVGSSFEAQMSKVRAISGASAEEAERLAEKASEMGRTTKFTATEAGEALEYMAMAGWKTDDMLDGLEGIMNLAAAAGADLGTTSDIVTDALTAFGKSAEDAGKLADIMAVASTNANTNVELMGETFKYAAPVAGALGYTMEDTAEAIGLMANAGIKGSQAGTDLRSIMTRLATNAGATKTSMGALEVLTEKLGVEFYNADGSARGLNDVLTDARVVWGNLSEEEQINYAKTIAGQRAMSSWLAIMNAGEDDIAKLEGALQNCDGAAQNMAETMQDNLQGKLTLFNSATEGLGVALYNYFSGPLSDIVEMATGFINGITDAITPQKTELDRFIESIEAEQSALATAINDTKEKINAANTQLAETDAYEKVILELQEIINKGGELDEFQKFQMQNAVEALSGSVPELAQNFDSATGAINLTNQEIETLINNSKDMALQNAMIEAQTEAYSELAKATIEKAKADSAAAKAQKELDTWLNQTGLTAVQASNQIGPLKNNWMELQDRVTDTRKIQEEVNSTYSEAESIVDETAAAIVELSGRIRENTSSTEENADATQNADEVTQGIIDSINALSEEEDDLAESTEELTDAQLEAIDAFREMFSVTDEGLEQMRENFESDAEFADWCKDRVAETQKIIDAYNSLVKSIESSLESFVSGIDASGEEGTRAIDNIVQNLEDRNQKLQTWVDNMRFLGEMAGKGLPQAMYDELVADGPEKTMEAVQALVDAARSETGEFEQVASEYEKGLALKQSAETIASYTQAGKDYQEAVKNGYKGTQAEFEKQVKESAKAGAEAGKDVTDEFSEVGEQAGENTATGVTETAGEVEQASEEMVDAAKEAAAQIANRFTLVGQSVPQKFRQGIHDTISSAGTASEEMISAARKVLSESMTEFKADGKEIARNIKDGFDIGSAEVSRAVKDLMREVGSEVKDSKYDFEDAGYSSAEAYANAISRGEREAYYAARDLAKNAFDAVDDWYDNWHTAGYNMSVGLANGIASGSSSAINNAYWLAYNSLQTAKNVLGINSPSKEFEEIGKYSDEGMAIGFARNQDLVEQAARESAQKAMRAAEAEMDGTSYYADLTGQINYAGMQKMNQIANMKIDTADTASAMRHLTDGMGALSSLAESLANPQAPNVTVMIGNREFKGYIVNTAEEGLGQKHKNLMKGVGG